MINDSKTINDLDLPLSWLLGELPILLASVANFEQYNTKTRLTTSEFLQVILTLSNKVDTTPIREAIIGLAQVKFIANVSMHTTLTFDMSN